MQAAAAEWTDLTLPVLTSVLLRAPPLGLGTVLALLERADGAVAVCALRDLALRVCVCVIWPFFKISVLPSRGCDHRDLKYEPDLIKSGGRAPSGLSEAGGAGEGPRRQVPTAGVLWRGHVWALSRSCTTRTEPRPSS